MSSRRLRQRRDVDLSGGGPLNGSRRRPASPRASGCRVGPWRTCGGPASSAAPGSRRRRPPRHRPPLHRRQIHRASGVRGAQLLKPRLQIVPLLRQPLARVLLRPALASYGGFTASGHPESCPPSMSATSNYSCRAAMKARVSGSNEIPTSTRARPREGAAPPVADDGDVAVAALADCRLRMPHTIAAEIRGSLRWVRSRAAISGVVGVLRRASLSLKAPTR